MFSDKCMISKYLAYAMLAYSFASFYYIVMTRNVGTPFRDSLTSEQIQIKKQNQPTMKHVNKHGNMPNKMKTQKT